MKILSRFLVITSFVVIAGCTDSFKPFNGPTSDPQANPGPSVEFSFDAVTKIVEGLDYTEDAKPEWKWKITRSVDGPTTVRTRIDSAQLAEEKANVSNSFKPTADLAPG